MKSSKNKCMTFTKFLIASFFFLIAFGAQVDGKWDPLKKIKAKAAKAKAAAAKAAKAAKAATKAAADKAKAAKDAVDKASADAAAKAKVIADQAAKEAQAAADQAIKDVKEAEAKVAAAAKELKAQAARLATKGAAISKTELETLSAQSQKTYANAAKTVVAGYDALKEELDKAGKAAQQALFLNSAKKAIAANKKFLNAFKTNIKNLDAEGVAARNRVVRAIAINEIDEQIRSDIEQIAEKLGLLAGEKNCIIPKDSKNKPLKSSIGIFISAGASAGGGAELAYSLIMNTFPDENGNYSMGTTLSPSGSVGVQEGAGAQIGFTWAPCPVENSEGLSIGLGVEATVGPGVAMGLCWSVTKGMFKDSKNAIPSFSLGVTGGQSFSLALSESFSFLIPNINGDKIY